MPAPESLRVLERAIGESAGPDLLDSLRRTSDDAVSDLVEEVLASTIEPSAVPDENEVWPLINSRTSTFTAGGSNPGFVDAAGAAGINLFAAVDPRISGSGRFSNSLLRALLYSHGLVIEDPLALAADMYRGTSAEIRAIARQFVEAGAGSLVEIAELLQAGVVETFFGRSDNAAAAEAMSFMTGELTSSDSEFDVEMVWEAFEADYVSQLHPGLQQIWAEVRAGNRTPPMEHVHDALKDTDAEVISTFVDVVATLRPRAVVDNAIGVVAESLADIANFGGVHDVFCPTRLFARLVFLGSSDPVHALRVRELARIEIPNLEGLGVHDVVAIRRDSEAFSLWRIRLSQGLERAAQIRDQVGQVDAFTAVGEVIADARTALFREFEQSKSLSARLAQPLSFVAGALAGAAGGATGGTAGMAVGSAAGLLPPLVARIAARGYPVPGFLRRHYMLFDRNR